MIHCYVRVDALNRPLKKDEVPVLNWALVGKSIVDILEQAGAIGVNPVIVFGPYQLGPDWR